MASEKDGPAQEWPDGKPSGFERLRKDLPERLRLVLDKAVAGFADDAKDPADASIADGPVISDLETWIWLDEPAQIEIRTYLTRRFCTLEINNFWRRHKPKFEPELDLGDYYPRIRRSFIPLGVIKSKTGKAERKRVQFCDGRLGPNRILHTNAKINKDRVEKAFDRLDYDLGRIMAVQEKDPSLTNDDVAKLWGWSWEERHGEEVSPELGLDDEGDEEL
jgi:hypothetical protein